MMSASHSPNFWPRFATLIIFLLFGLLIGAMGRVIAVLLGIGFIAAPLWFTGLILVYVGTNMFSRTMLRNFADWFRLPITVPEPDAPTRRISGFVWTVFLTGSLTGYLVTALILKGAS